MQPSHTPRHWDSLNGTTMTRATSGECSSRSRSLRSAASNIGCSPGQLVQTLPFLGSCLPGLVLARSVSFATVFGRLSPKTEFLQLGCLLGNEAFEPGAGESVDVPLT